MLQSVIMAGGSGTRFWPQSRRQLPKQFLRVFGDETLIQQACSRCQPEIPNVRLWIVTGAVHAEETKRQLPKIPTQQILVEPCGRNTAPCIGLAAIQMLHSDPDAVMLVMPADHVIKPVDQFQRAMEQAVKLIADQPSSLVLIGIEPEYPATGFGYIHRGQQIPTTICPTYQVKGFQEKPNAETASRFMASGDYYWNCGIFAWRAETILKALEEFAPEITYHLEQLRPFIGTNEWQEALNTEFPKMPSISIDYAVLEKASGQTCVLEAPFEWDDVGSWQALPRLFESDNDDNTVDGQCCSVDTQGCIIRSTESHLIATIGIKDLIIVHTPTATLVADKTDESSLKKLIAELEQRGMTEYL